MPKSIPTNINAYYAELIKAKQELAVADAKVKELEDYITGQGHLLPDEEGVIPAVEAEAQAEHVADASDVSAAESTNNQRGKK